MLSHLCALNMYTIHFMYDNSKATNIFYLSSVKNGREVIMFSLILLPNVSAGKHSRTWAGEAKKHKICTAAF